MPSQPSFLSKLFVTACAFTHTTEFFVRRTGVGAFLPRLFASRFANLLGIDPADFEELMKECKSFEDEKWTAFWRAHARREFRNADKLIAALGGPSVSDIVHANPSEETLAKLAEVLAPASRVFSDRSPDTIREVLASFDSKPLPVQKAAKATDSLVKAMVYLTVSSWPGWTEERLKDYWAARRLFESLLKAMGPKIGLVVETLCVEVQGENVAAFAVFPRSAEKVPTILMSNGLEGSIQELLLPSLNYRGSGIGVVAMEMPGTFSYRSPLSDASEVIYREVIGALITHPRVDGSKLGMFGASFGAYWATRMAAKDKRIAAVVSNGGPYHHSFSPKATLGLPEIMLSTMINTTGATSSMDLGKKFHSLSIRHLYSKITQPCLVINGEKDTLISTQDSIDLAGGAGGALVLYPDDDHCAMGNYATWSRLVQEWFAVNLGYPQPVKKTEAARG